MMPIYYEIFCHTNIFIYICALNSFIAPANIQNMFEYETSEWTFKQNLNKKTNNIYAMNKILIITVCIMAGIGTLYAQGDITPPKINPCYGNEFFRKQQVTFSCATEGARIFYTIDGTVPTTLSTEYSEDSPLYIDRTVTIKAIAVNGESTSEVKELTCEKSQRAFLIVGDNGGKKYYMAKEKVTEEVNTHQPLAAYEYADQTLLSPKYFENMAWLQISNGKIVSKSQQPYDYLTYDINTNSTRLDTRELQAQSWEISAKELISAHNKKIYIYKNDFFQVLESSTDNNKAYPVDITKGKARTGLTVGNFGTICLPYNVIVSDTEGATFYNILGKKEDNGKTTLYLEEENGILKATIPYIYKVNNENICFYYLDEIKSSEGSEDFGSHNGLTGVARKSIVPKGKYIINGTKVVKCGNNCTIQNGCAYIDMDNVPTITDIKAKNSITLSTGGTTNITDATSENENTSAHYYNLQGQRVTSPNKGLYIRNGKKVIIK